MSLRGKIASVAMTDTGKVREHNEDMIGTEADIGLFVLADGMGGYNAATRALAREFGILEMPDLN